MKRILITKFILVFSIILFHSGFAENIDPMNDGSQYAYGENVGWFNFEPMYGTGVTVWNYKVTGCLWAENIGWINLSPISYGGVMNDGNGNLSGYAWGENVGWINFDPTYGGVRVDSRGYIEGWAWGENIGWIHLQDKVDLAILRSGANQFTLLWNSTLNFKYQLFISTDLSAWTQQGLDITGSDGITMYNDLFVGMKKFYKIIQVNPPGYRVRTSW